MFYIFDSAKYDLTCAKYLEKRESRLENFTNGSFGPQSKLDPRPEVDCFSYRLRAIESLGIANDSAVSKSSRAKSSVVTEDGESLSKY